MINKTAFCSTSEDWWRNEKRRDLIVALVSLIFPSVFAFCYFVLFPEPPVSSVFYGISRVFLIAFPFLWTVAGEKKPLPFPRFKSGGLGVGSITGLLIAIAALVLYKNVFKELLDVSEVIVKATQFGFAGKNFQLFALFIIIVNATLEEYYWRWFSTISSYLLYSLDGITASFSDSVCLGEE